jgi:hypothetical protein
VLHRPVRPLALVLLLSVGDYLLWNWSLGGRHETMALISGLALPPLLIVLLWLFVLGAVRLLTGAGRRPRVNSGRRFVSPTPRTAAESSAGRVAPADRAHPAHGSHGVAAAGEASPASPSSKLAA